MGETVTLTDSVVRVIRPREATLMVVPSPSIDVDVDFIVVKFGILNLKRETRITTRSMK